MLTQRAEGDDLRHPVAAVAFLDVGDDLLAAVHAEIDVEIRHRHALGIEEPLEEQPVAQRVQIGDRQRIGHERARARPAPGTDRDSALLGPLDEIRDDQEIAGKTHAFDHAELEIQPRLVFRDRDGMRNHRQPLRQPLARLPAQLVDLVVREARQDRIAGPGAERAAPRDLDGVLDRLGQILEQSHHLVGGLEAMIGRQAPPRLLLVDIGAVRDADQRVVGVMHAPVREMHVIGRHQRQVEIVGEAHQSRLGRQFRSRAARAVLRMPLHLDIEPVAESRLEPFRERRGLVRVPVGDQRAERPVRASGQTDQPLGMRLQSLDRDMRQAPARTRGSSSNSA